MTRQYLLAALLFFFAGQARADEASPFGTPPVVTPTGPMRGAVLLFSDHGGLADADRMTAEALGKAGVLVAEIDTDAYLAHLAEAKEDCHFIVPDLELLSRQLQRAHPGATYHTPILAGRGLGGTLAAEAMAEVNKSGDGEGDDGGADEGVGDSAVVLEGGNRSAEVPDEVEVGRFGGERHGQGGVGGSAVEAGSGEAGSG